MERAEPESPLTHLQHVRVYLCEKIEKNRLEVKKLTEARDILDLVIANVAKYAIPVVRNPPASLTVPAPFPVGALDALGAFNDFDDVGDISFFAEYYALDTVANVADTTAAPATADPPAALLDGPDYYTLVAATAATAVLPTAPSITPAALYAARPPAATLTTLAFIALVALHATLAADSSAAALVPCTTVMDADSPTEKLDALPPPLPIVATTATKTNSAMRAANVTTDTPPAAAQDISEDMAPPAKLQRTPGF
ncbi:hypothetical protein GGI13_001048 [Coemansia sp. RSA 455]|nr:hypothetical protein GGI13_001048 [Coemansia sp. RSA 455]